MATEPERPIEKLLRACAKKRRDELPEPPGLELHPATRRLLQGEVARRFGRGGTQPGSLLRRIMLFRLGLVEGLVIIALMAVVASIMLPSLAKSKGKATLAMNRRLVPAQPLNEAMPEPAAPVVRSPAEAVNGSSHALVASADNALDQREKQGRLKDSEAEVAKDRTVAGGGKMAPETAITMNTVPGSEARRSDAAPVAFGAGTRAVPPTPSESPLLARNYDTAAGSVARNDVPAATPIPAAAPMADMTLGLAEKKPSGELLKSKSETAGQLGFAYNSMDKNASQPAPVVAADTKEAPVAALADESKASRELAALSPAQPQTVAGEESGASKDTGLVQRFSRVEATWGAKGGPSSTPLQPVLASFQVEQAGQEFRVVDSDGSVYSGTLQTPGGPIRQRATRSQSFAPARVSGAAAGRAESAVTVDALQLAEHALFFRVAGTNRSLKQKVVFTGSLLGLTNAAAVARMNDTIGGGMGGFQSTPAKQGLAPLQSLRISGKVVVGNGKAIEINALPTSGPAK